MISSPLSLFWRDSSESSQKLRKKVYRCAVLEAWWWCEGLITHFSNKSEGQREREKALWRRKQQGTAITYKEDKSEGGYWIISDLEVARDQDEKTTAVSLGLIWCREWKRAGWRRKKRECHTCSLFGCKYYFPYSCPAGSPTKTAVGETAK